MKYGSDAPTVPTWAGMRGRISISLALGITDGLVVHAVPAHMTNSRLIFLMTFSCIQFLL